MHFAKFNESLGDDRWEAQDVNMRELRTQRTYKDMRFFKCEDRFKKKNPGEGAMKCCKIGFKI